MFDNGDLLGVLTPTPHWPPLPLPACLPCLLWHVFFFFSISIFFKFQTPRTIHKFKISQWNLFASGGRPEAAQSRPMEDIRQGC